MPSPITSILRQLSKKDKLSVLTFPFDHIFDSYWNLVDMDITMWLFKTQKYPINLLPAAPRKLETENIPIGLDFDIIISHDPFTHNIARQLSHFYHLPICFWSHGSEQLRSNLVISSLIKEDSVPIISHIEQKVNRQPKEVYLTKFNDLKNVSTILQGFRVEALHYNFDRRHQQYEYASGLINLNTNYCCVEIEECKSNGIPVISLDTKFHKECLIFENDQACIDLVNKNRKNITPVATQGKTIEQFNSELKDIITSLGEYVHVPI